MTISLRSTRATLGPLALLLALGSPARADKINASYINSQPAPLGTLTQEMAQDFNSTYFNRFIIMGLTFSSSSPATPANPLVWGSGQPLDATWKVASPGALAVVKALGAGSQTKEVFVSLIGSSSANYLGGLSTASLTPDAKICATAQGSGNINCAVFYLDQFVQAYGLAGLDLDLETFSNSGFANLIQALGAYGWEHKISFAPYVDCNHPLMPCVFGGSCALQDAGFADFGVGRQYYAGGFATNVAGTLANEFTQAAATTCPRGSKLRLGAPAMIVGMSPYSVLGGCFSSLRGGPNNCHYYYDDPNTPNCFDSVAAAQSAFPTLGGAYAWTIELLDAHYYSCCMDQVLNGHANRCPDPKPIPGDADPSNPPCPPIRFKNCSLKTTG